MKKLISTLITFVIVLSMSCVSFASFTGSKTHEYDNHREKASVTVDTKPIGGQWFVGVELWNSSGRFPDYDDISSGTFTSISFKTHSADTGTYSGATRGYYATYAKDIDGDIVSGTSGHGFDS